MNSKLFLKSKTHELYIKLKIQMTHYLNHLIKNCANVYQLN